MKKAYAIFILDCSFLPGMGRIDEPDAYCGGYPPPHLHARRRIASRKNTARLIQSQNLRYWV